MGYHRAGFRVIGVDVEPQPRYPFEFVLADGIEFLREFGWLADAVHASPPCHDHTSLRSRAGTNGTGHLLGEFRGVLERLTVPWAIENVPGAPMRVDLVLCGEQFGLRTVRHRWFESNVALRGGTTCGGRHLRPTSTKNRVSALAEGHNISVTGNVGRHVGVPCLGIDWMTGSELSQAIPPAYTEHVGRQLMAHLGVGSTDRDEVGRPR